MLYRGELLPDCYEDWIIPPREQLRQRYLLMLGKLIHLLEEQRAYPAAIAYGQRLLHADPLQESTYHTLMRLYVRNGDRALALRTYHTCTTRLQQELGVAPGPEMQAAYHRLLQLDTVASTPPVPLALGQPGGLLIVRCQAERELHFFPNQEQAVAVQYEYQDMGYVVGDNAGSNCYW